jgi:hypothetical protein
MLRLPLALAALGLLAGCNQAEEATPISFNATTKDGAPATAAMDKDGRVRIDTPVLKADVKLPRLAIDAAELDLDGMKLFPGAKVAGMEIQARDGRDRGGVRLNFDAPAGMDEVRGWFAAEARRAGFDMRVDGPALVGTSKDGSPVRIEFAEAGAGRTRGSVTLSERRK